MSLDGLEALGLLVFTDPVLGALAAIEVRGGALDTPVLWDKPDRKVPLGESRARQIVEGLAHAGLKIVKAACREPNDQATHR